MQIKPDPGRVNCRGCREEEQAGKGWNVPGCAVCGGCKGRHCGCRPCKECHRTHPRKACQVCHHCPRGPYCRCKRRAGGIAVEDTLVHAAKAPLSLERITRPGKPTRATTIELELATYAPYAQRETRPDPLLPRGVAWKHEHDGSIRGPNPAEFIIGPIAGQELQRITGELGVWLRSREAGTNNSCGLHVHVDARDLDPFGMRRMLALWQVLEGPFYELCQKERSDSLHCRRVPAQFWKGLEGMWDLKGPRAHRSFQHLLLETLYQDTVALPVSAHHGAARTQAGAERAVIQSRLRGNNGRLTQRYWGLNLHSYFFRGTVEFRMHEGCHCADRILHWAQWCQWFVDLASRLTDPEVRAIQEPMGYLQGAWKRPYGWLTLPGEVRAFAFGGRDRTPYGGCPTRRGDEDDLPRLTQTELTLMAAAGRPRPPAAPPRPPSARTPAPHTAVEIAAARDRVAQNQARFEAAAAQNQAQTAADNLLDALGVQTANAGQAGVRFTQTNGNTWGMAPWPPPTTPPETEDQ